MGEAGGNEWDGVGKTPFLDFLKLGVSPSYDFKRVTTVIFKAH